MYDCKTLEKTREKKCPICAKRFRYYPQWHRWQAKVRGSMTNVCSYTCMRKVERGETERVKKYLEDQEMGKPVSGNPIRPDLRKVPLTEDELRERIRLCRKKYKAFFDEENAKKTQGTWYAMKLEDRKRIQHARYYWEKRAEGLQQELEMLDE